MNPNLEEKTPEQAAELLRTLGHPIRIDLIAALHGDEASVTELSHTLDYSRNTVSKHLKALRDIGMVEQK
jgi:DNA-binding transcriptional ArsR family regulator